MAWNLEIHTIDIGQGDSSLIVASDPVAGITRSMLIDGGHAVYGETIHDYLTGPAGANLPNGVDVILVSHYDVDHSGGVISLLLADNMWWIADDLAADALASAVGANRPQRVAATTAAVAAAAWGGTPGEITAQANAARGAVAGAATDAQAANAGIVAAVAGLHYTNPLILPSVGQRARRAARAAGIAAANGIANGDAGPVLQADIQSALLGSLQSGLPVGARFDTGGIYSNVTVVDIGNTAHMPMMYQMALNGTVLLGGNFGVNAQVNRARVAAPALGAEVLWNAGPGAAAPAANAPAAVVVARRAQVWQGIGQPVVNVASGQPDNDDSIGLIVRFNTFAFWTAGDLPSQGEDPMAAAVMAMPLPRPGGVGLTYPVPHRIAAFKCSHHGANTATSAAFLAAAVPRVAVISTGFNAAFQHPAVPLIARLHAAASVGRFFLTNCNFATVGIPASNGINQLTAVGNISRVCGDNGLPNLAPGRNRGNVLLFASQASTTALLPQFGVNYWEDDLAPPAFNPTVMNY
jgi:beta-lactamase superfamily II metal-dependent hydrolase